MTNRVTSKSFRKCTVVAARRQNSYQQTNKQTNSTYPRSLITKILLKLYFSPNIVSLTFRQVILAILPLYLVYCHVLVAYNCFHVFVCILIVLLSLVFNNATSILFNETKESFAVSDEFYSNKGIIR